MSCFLPLSDSAGLPVIVSGDVLTDPSRTHAVVDDPSTQSVIADAALLLAEILRSPEDPLCEILWSAFLSAEDPRALMLASEATVASSLLHALQAEFVDGRRPLGSHPWAWRLRTCAPWS